MKKTTIDANILPHAWLYWTTSKANFYVDCKTNENQNKAPKDVVFGWNNKNDVLYRSGSNPIWAYAKYHEDIEMLEIAAATFDTRRTAESHEWKYAGDKYFIDKYKIVYNENGNVHEGIYNLYDHHATYNFKDFLGMFQRLSAHDNVMKEFHKFIGGTTFTNATGKVYEAQWTWHIKEWYIRKQKVNNKGKETKLTETLTAIPLKDLSNIGVKYPPIIDRSRGWADYINGIMYFERVNDEWSVLRMFSRSYNGDNLREVERMYLHDKGANRIATPEGNSGGWIHARQFCDYQKYQFVNKDEAMEKCKRLKYIVPLLEEEYSIKRALMTALRFPEIEQLIKLGYGDFARKIANSSYPKADMKHAFGEYYNEKGKNLLNKVGLTKHQLDKHMSEENSRRGYYYKSSGLVLEKMRGWFGDDLIHLDNKMFDRYYDAFNVMYSRCGSRFESNLDRIRVDKKKFIKNMIRLGEKHESAYTIMIDTVSMWLQLSRDIAPEIDWYFDSYSDAVRTHDAIMELKRMQDAERMAIYNKAEAERLKKEEEKRKKIDEKRKEFEYEDENFIIRLPKNGNEIVSEGAKQHICIGGYVSRHSLGNTNLFFIRKKSDPEHPFYAIEMNNYNEIVQIHGFGNKWLGNNPEVIPTVVRWLRKNGIKCKETILTCAATGYSSMNANHVPMPVVD